MKLRELIEKVDRSHNNECCADIDGFCEALGIDEYPGWFDEFDSTVKGYHLSRWLCTDSHVGMVVYFMGDQPVAVGVQLARKSKEDIEFVSIEAAQEVKDFILSLLQKEPFHPPVLDLDYECGTYYTVNYHCELLTDKGFYRGEEVVVVRRKMDYNEPSQDWRKVDVTLPDGLMERISMDDFIIPYHIKEN